MLSFDNEANFILNKVTYVITNVSLNTVKFLIECLKYRNNFIVNDKTNSLNNQLFS